MLFCIFSETRQLGLKTHHELLAFVQNNMKKILVDGDTAARKTD